MASAVYTPEQVSVHNKESDCWIIVHGLVYNVTDFLKDHPGGKKILLKVAGKDASSQFDAFHSSTVLDRFGPKLVVGRLSTASSTPSTSQDVLTTSEKPGDIWAKYGKDYVPNTLKFGDGYAFGDPAWYRGTSTPYYKESHKKLRAFMRNFVDTELIPFCHEWDEAKEVPKHMFKRFAELGLLAAALGGKYPTKYCPYPPPAGIPAEEWDVFHEYVMNDELARCASSGVLWAILSGVTIGIPPILYFGSEDLRERVVRPVLSGDKRICLAITEPTGGSDVANLRTEARKTDDGKHYIVNGEKKWITNGVWADYFTAAVRTGGPGMGGISLLVVPRVERVTTRQMKCSGVWSSGTTYVTFEDVKAPVENLVGKENQGFKYVMYNFNHERMGMVQTSTRFARVCLEEAVKFAMKRKTFGKPLISQPVIRAKIAEMARLVESTQSWVEHLIDQTRTQGDAIQQEQLGGTIALAKAHCGRVFELCAREASQILGGASYTRGGVGEKVERLYREVRAYAIPGGSEEIMFDLGVRQNLKSAKL